MDGYIDRRQKKGDKPASINRVLEILRRAYRLAKLVPPDITRLEENNARTGFLSRAEFDRLNEFLPADLRDFFLFAFLTGMRLKEIKSLTWSDVTGNVVQLQGIHAKTKKGRTLVCAGELGPLLERLKRARTFTDAGGNTKMAGTLFHRGGEPGGFFAPRSPQ